MWKEGEEWMPCINSMCEAGLNKVCVTVNLLSDDETGFADLK